MFPVTRHSRRHGLLQAYLTGKVNNLLPMITKCAIIVWYLVPNSFRKFAVKLIYVKEHNKFFFFFFKSKTRVY
jgi:hypothetical protein